MRAKDFDTCYSRAVSMYNTAKKNGGSPQLIQVAGYKGDPSLADARWQEIPAKNWHHYLVVDGDTVWDPSHEQFGSTEASYSVDKLASQWDKVYEIR
jgi:hypothetical protein